MDTQVYLRSQTELLAELEARLRDTGNVRWTDAEIYQALNDTLDTWSSKVLLPYLYTISGGWLSSTYAYALPAYVRPPLYPEVEREVPYRDEDIPAMAKTWQPIAARSETDGAGGLVLRLMTPAQDAEGRVRFYAPNGRVPTTVPTTSGSTASTATSLTLGSAVDVDDVGHVKINAEWLSYAGVTRGASTTVLDNLVRGLYGTTAATHNTGSSVAWGVGADSRTLWQQLRDQTQANCYRMQIGDGSVHETGRYEQYMNYYQTRADQFWTTYRPQRPAPRLLPNRRLYAWT